MGTGKAMDDPEKLACLAVRLGLDFRATSWTERENERRQVERHMRLCLAATPGFHNMVTISPSEPLLAEAAYKIVEAEKVDMAQALLGHIDSSYLNAGDRGEVIAALLLLLARDKAIGIPHRTNIFPVTSLHNNGKQDLENDGDRKGRILTVLEFLDALLPAAENVAVRKQKPYRSPAVLRERKLEETFKGFYIWFNHFIKVHDFDVVNQQYLWRLILRGAALICANNHRGIDIVIPTISGPQLKPECVSAILIQVKNDRSYTAKIRTSLFTGMDPFRVGLFSKGKKGVPAIIRMVFALGSNVPSVTVKESSLSGYNTWSSKERGDNYTSYDIWVAGATDQSFGVIKSSEISTYAKLLERSCKIFDGYDMIDKAALPSETQKEERARARRKMHPGAATESEHYENYVLAEDFSVELGDSDEDV